MAGNRQILGTSPSGSQDTRQQHQPLDLQSSEQNEGADCLIQKLLKISRQEEQSGREPPEHSTPKPRALGDSREGRSVLQHPPPLPAPGWGQQRQVCGPALPCGRQWGLRMKSSQGRPSMAEFSHILWQSCSTLAGSGVSRPSNPMLGTVAPVRAQHYLCSLFLLGTNCMLEKSKYFPNAIFLGLFCFSA